MKNEKPQSPKKKSKFRRLLRVFAVLMFLGLVGVVILAVYLANTESVITVSKETTRIVTPLDDQGNVDYLAAVIEISSEGVTPKNNAAVLFAQAFGPSVISTELRDAYFEKLGISPLPEKGDYQVEYNQFVKQTTGEQPSEEQLEHHQQARSRPWSAAEFPLVAEWLKANAKPLNLIVEGTMRSHLYFPPVNPESPQSLPMLSIASLTNVRIAGGILTVRAMQRLHEGKVEEAWQDLLACHRLSRLVGQGLFVVSSLVSVSTTQRAFEGDVALIEHGKLTAEQALRMQGDLRKLAPLPTMTENVVKVERFMYLDNITAMARQTADGPSSVSGSLHHIALRTVDWDEVLRIWNVHFDRSVEAGRLPSFAERKAAFNKLLGEVRSTNEELRSKWSLVGSFFEGRSPRRNISNKTAAFLMGFWGGSSMQLVSDAEDRFKTRREMLQLGFALAAYRADKDGYPSKLEDLTPKFIKTIPNDPFSGKPFLYVQKEDGFLLYSVGLDMKDNGGLTYDSETEGDDIILRIPVESVEQK